MISMWLVKQCLDGKPLPYALPPELQLKNPPPNAPQQYPTAPDVRPNLSQSGNFQANNNNNNNAGNTPQVQSSQPSLYPQTNFSNNENPYGQQDTQNAFY